MYVRCHPVKSQLKILLVCEETEKRNFVKAYIEPNDTI